MYRTKRFFRKCRNVIRWIPTIWKDEDWDQTYIYDMLLLKLERQRDFFLSDRAYASNAKENSDKGFVICII